ncbi:hypothetical protein C8J57DRAFT_1309605 [Mycena rebaudengoi]|nr:hypothetical protein C8J57DRAFT_1309605 [Mycena rebaudengoi]
MLPHPYFPDRVFWTNKTTWSWYAIATVRESRRDIMSDKHLNECSDADALATALIQRALRNEEEKKRRRVEERDTAKSRKKPRLSVSSAASDHEAVLDSELDEALIISTRAAAKARSHSELVARLESENLGLQAKLDELMNQPAPPAAPQSVPFPPEFLGFMTETFSSQVVLNCRAQAETAAAEANKKVVALLSELGMAQQANAHFVQTLRAAEAHWKQECAKSQSATEKGPFPYLLHPLRSDHHTSSQRRKCRSPVRKCFAQLTWVAVKVANRCFELSLEKQATLGKQSRVASEAALAEGQQAFERTDEALKHANEALKAMEAREEQGSIVQAAATHSGAIETAGLQSSPRTFSRFASGSTAAHARRSPAGVGPGRCIEGGGRRQSPIQDP